MSTSVARHSGEFGSWEMVSRTAPPALAGHVRRYCGYEERTHGPLARTEAPRPEITLIVSLGPTLEVFEPSGAARTLTSFVVGLHDTHARTAHAGFQRGIEVNLSPLAARDLLGVPMGELANRVVALEDLLGDARARELADRIEGAGSWEARFELLDRLLSERLAAAPATAPPAVDWAWRRLVASHGAARVGALASEIGCSPRYLALRFQEHVGLSPKTVARLMRFDHARGMLERDDGSRFAEIAEGCGYYDQAHLNRDFRAFAGAAPGEFLARRLPDGGGVAAGEFASVQDGAVAAA